MPSVSSAFASLAGLAVPLTCASCGVQDEQVCRACRLELAGCLWAGGARRCAPDPPPRGLPDVHAAGRYRGPLARIVAAYKDDDRRDCAALLGEILAAALDAALASSPPHGQRVAAGNGPLLLVPVPSSAAARRKRGDAPLGALATAAAAGFIDRELVVAEALRPRRRVADQAGLTAVQRATNVEHSMVVRPRWETAVAGAACVVVDDVLTTGATLVEATRALRAAGSGPVVAATICATQRRSRPSGQVSARSR
jgi:predicted amidophosphoribosyltransferase